MTDFQRQEHNKRILDMFMKGESLAAMTPADTWFPPRPILKKSADALKILPEKKAEKVIPIRGF